MYLQHSYAKMTAKDLEASNFNSSSVSHFNQSAPKYIVYNQSCARYIHLVVTYMYMYIRLEWKRQKLDHWFITTTKRCAIVGTQKIKNIFFSKMCLQVPSEDQSFKKYNFSDENDSFPASIFCMQILDCVRLARLNTLLRTVCTSWSYQDGRFVSSSNLFFWVPQRKRRALVIVSCSSLAYTEISCAWFEYTRTLSHAMSCHASTRLDTWMDHHFAVFSVSCRVH